jgi:hypothetical protein
MQNLALFVFSDFRNDRIKPTAHPANGHILFRDVGSLIEPIRPGEQLARQSASDMTVIPLWPQIRWRVGEGFAILVPAKNPDREKNQIKRVPGGPPSVGCWVCTKKRVGKLLLNRWCCRR